MDFYSYIKTLMAEAAMQGTDWSSFLSIRSNVGFRITSTGLKLNQMGPSDY